MSRSLTNVRIAIVSRCSRTLYTFRRPLIHRLIDERAQVTTIGSSGEGYEDLLSKEGITFRHAPVSRRSVNPGADLRLFVNLVRQFREIRPHIVHSFTVKPAIYATLAAARAGVPARVVTITGLGHAFTTASPFITRATEWLYRVALARASLVYFQNPEDRELFSSRRLVGPERTRLIPGSGVDLGRFVPEPLPYQSGDTVNFLMIARLLKEKGVCEFMSAADRLRKANVSARFRLVGGIDGRNPSSLAPAEIESLRNSAAVEWVGDVLDVRPHVAWADVVVLPSYREGLPRSLLEGGAMGRALIASNVPGCRDVVRDGHNGYLVPVGNAEFLAQAMAKLAADPSTIERFGRCARVTVEDRFDEQVVVSETIKAYLQLLPETSRMQAELVHIDS
jgi:glycosyltransferase involved in cell wall biosynthesis